MTKEIQNATEDGKFEPRVQCMTRIQNFKQSKKKYLQVYSIEICLGRNYIHGHFMGFLEYPQSGSHIIQDFLIFFLWGHS